MASYSVAASEHKTLSASTVDTATFSTDKGAVMVEMRVPASGSTGIYFTTNGSTPTVGGSDTFWVPPSIGAFKIVPSLGSDVVKLISSTADAYSVLNVDGL